MQYYSGNIGFVLLNPIYSIIICWQYSCFKLIKNVNLLNCSFLNLELSAFRLIVICTIIILFGMVTIEHHDFLNSVSEEGG